MTPDTRRAPAERARDELPERLVELLVDHVDQTYATAGLPGALSAVRDMLRRMDPADLRAMVYALELAVEPLREDEPSEPR